MPVRVSPLGVSVAMRVPMVVAPRLRDRCPYLYLPLGLLGDLHLPRHLLSDNFVNYDRLVHPNLNDLVTASATLLFLPNKVCLVDRLLNDSVNSIIHGHRFVIDFAPPLLTCLDLMLIRLVHVAHSMRMHENLGRLRWVVNNIGQDWRGCGRVGFHTAVATAGGWGGPALHDAEGGWRVADRRRRVDDGLGAGRAGRGTGSVGALVAALGGARGRGGAEDGLGAPRVAARARGSGRAVLGGVAAWFVRRRHGPGSKVVVQVVKSATRVGQVASVSNESSQSNCDSLKM